MASWPAPPSEHGLQHPAQNTASIPRRRVLQLTAAGMATASSSIGAILASGSAPTYAQRAAVHWLRWADFIPASDQLLRTKIVTQCEKDLGIKLNVEMINANEIQSRITSAVQSGTGPDIICALNNWPQLYTDVIVDVSDVAEEIGHSQNGFYETSKAVANEGTRWIAVPWCVVPVALANRTSWFAEIGYSPNTFPNTWEHYIEAGRRLKANAHPLGQTLGHTFGDAPAFWYPFLWSWGGKEVASDGRTVALNSKETIESVKFAASAWKAAFDEGGLAWDDSSNNRAFLSGSIGSTLNGASIYIEAKHKPNSYLTEHGKPLKDDIFHSPLPRGPAGQYSYHVPLSNMLMRYSKREQAAKDFLRWVSSKPIYAQWLESQQGFSIGATPEWEKQSFPGSDPTMAPFRTVARSGRFLGYPGPSKRQAAEGLTKFIIVDMYAKAVQGTAPEDAVGWAHGELVKIYGLGQERTVSPSSSDSGSGVFTNPSR
jgi:multiple sugar transport system substrate-binding protein